MVLGLSEGRIIASLLNFFGKWDESYHWGKRSSKGGGLACSFISHLIAGGS